MIGSKQCFKLNFLKKRIIIIKVIIIINRDYPNPCSGQSMLALIGWFDWVVILCGGTKAQKQQSHSNSGCWTGVLVTLIGSLCGTDPYNFMKKHVISIEEVSF